MAKAQAGTQDVIVEKVAGGSVVLQPDKLAIEEPLEIRLASPAGIKKVSITMRTPGNDKELAVGFLFTEGIIKTAREIKDVQQTEDSVITVHTTATPDMQSLERNFYTTSSCGVCGKASIDSIKTVSAYNPATAAITIRSSLLCELPGILRDKQRIFEDTGGLHASALFDAAGKLVLLREDVGRHNALDKLIGAALMDDMLPLDSSVLLLSGRASFELIQKATMAGIPIVAAVGAPSSLAVSMAEEAGTTLVGFLREKRFNIYTGTKRIVYENQDKR